MHYTLEITPEHHTTTPSVGAVRSAYLRRRFRASPEVEAALADLAFGCGDGVPSALRIAPATFEVRT